MADQHDLAVDLLSLARDDETAARTLIDADSPESIVGFHCQQAVEKALKAVLADAGLDFPFTHNIGLLIQLCEDTGVALPEDLADIDRLTPYAVHLRYGTVHAPTVELKIAVEWVARTLAWASARIEPR